MYYEPGLAFMRCYGKDGYAPASSGCRPVARSPFAGCSLSQRRYSRQLLLHLFFRRINLEKNVEKLAKAMNAFV